MAEKTIAELVAADPARRRVALPVTELSDEDMVLIAQSRVPAEHDFEYENDPPAASITDRS